MPGIVEGYNYDIFISYRQKDNKGDMWVSEFVEALKTELESTFKEEISVYFDINPHDGLLETHDVDESLREKLKCLVFIPIISRTYCDPKSFAWEHEFRAFVEEASEDELGLKIKLPNGNVASRVLPVQIHDLDDEDISMCESVLGSVLRGIEFIYKSAGVNRPLRAAEDHPQDNINKTYYRDQINKVANAIKEIISAIKHPEQTSDRVPGKSDLREPAEPKNRISTIIAGSVIALLLIAAGLIFIPKLFKPDDQIEKSIAVLPFRNDSPDQENSAFVNGLMEKILNNLQLIKDFRVLSRTTVEQYRDPSQSATDIARELGVNYIVEGSGQRYGDDFSLSVQLIKADKKEDHLWGHSYEQKIRKVDDILKIQSEIARAIAKELEANLTAEEKQRIDKVSTESLTALDFYQAAREEYMKYQADPYNLTALDEAGEFYKKAKRYDPAFADAYVGLAEVYWNKHAYKEYQRENYLDSVLVLANEALSYDKDLAEAYQVRGQYFYGIGLLEKALQENEKAIDINPSLWQAYLSNAGIYLLIDDPLEGLKNIDKALSYYRGPELPSILSTAGLAYAWAGFPEIARKYAEEKLELDSDSAAYFSSLGHIAFCAGKLEDDLKYDFKALKNDSTNLNLLRNIGQLYSFRGNYKDALVYIDKWLGLQDNNLKASSWYNTMHRVGYIYWKNNRFDEAENYFDLQLKYSTDQINSGIPLGMSIYPSYDRAGVYAFMGQKEKAIEDLLTFSQLHMVPSMMITFIKYDPLFDSIRNEPDYQQIISNIETKFQEGHERVRKWLEENDKL